jgi:Zn-dependent protease
VNNFSFGHIFGFPVVIQPTALFVLALYMFMGGSGVAGLAQGFLVAFVIFSSILVHELGHAFAARAFRLGSIDITLHGFGGYTRMSRPPSAKQGLLVTAAGPAASLLLGGLALGLAVALPPTPFDRLFTIGASINLFWGVFNLIPMYPLDGGQLTRHGLSLFTHPSRALTWAARVGVVMAFLVGAGAALNGQYFIVFIAFMSLAQSLPLAGGGRP